MYKLQEYLKRKWDIHKAQITSQNQGKQSGAFFSVKMRNTGKNFFIQLASGNVSEDNCQAYKKVVHLPET